MTFAIVFITIAAFLCGSAIGIFAVVVTGIRSGDRAKNLTCAPRTGTEAVTRRLLGVGIRPAEADQAEPMSRDRSVTPGGDLT
jgi:hypothetical protein